MTFQTTGGGRRGYFRVRTCLAIRARPVADAEREDLEIDLLQRQSTKFEDLDPDLAAWMDRLERKLDRILVRLGADESEVRPTEVKRVSLSGGGLRFVADRAYEPDTPMLVEFELPGPPAILVRCIATVVESQRDGNGELEVALAFRTIRDQDREAIVQHGLAVQRSEIRSQRAAS